MSADKKHTTSLSGTTFGYKVWMRSASEQPIEIGERIIYPKWEPAYFREHTPGVPTTVPNEPDRHILHMHGLMSHQAAQALRWWIHAAHGEQIRTRLAKYRLEFSHTNTNEGFFDEHNGEVQHESPRHEAEVRAWTHKLDFGIDDLKSSGWTPVDDSAALGIGSAATKERVRRTGAKRTTGKPGASRATPKSN